MLSMNSRQMPTPSCKSWPFSRLRSGPGGIPSHPTPYVGKSEEAGEPESSRDRPRGSFFRYHDGLLTSRILASHEAVLLMFLVEHMEHMWGEFRERRPSLYAVPTWIAPLPFWMRCILRGYGGLPYGEGKGRDLCGRALPRLTCLRIGVILVHAFIFDKWGEVFECPKALLKRNR